MFRSLSKLACILLAGLFIFPAGPAAAYIGPGAGLGAFAVVLALGAGILLLIVGLVWFPMKRMLKKKKAAQTSNETPKAE